jgi:hypothetical protein
MGMPRSDGPSSVDHPNPKSQFAFLVAGVAILSNEEPPWHWHPPVELTAEMSVHERDYLVRYNPTLAAMNGMLREIAVRELEAAGVPPERFDDPMPPGTATEVERRMLELLGAWGRFEEEGAALPLPRELQISPRRLHQSVIGAACALMGGATESARCSAVQLFLNAGLWVSTEPRLQRKGPVDGLSLYAVRRAWRAYQTYLSQLPGPLLVKATTIVDAYWVGALGQLYHEARRERRDLDLDKGRGLANKLDAERALPTRVPETLGPDASRRLAASRVLLAALPVWQRCAPGIGKKSIEAHA